MESLHIIAIIGFILIIGTSVVPKKEKLIEKYKNLDANQIKSTNESAKKIKTLCLIFVFLLIPIIAGLILPKVNDSATREILINVMALAIFCGISVFGVYTKIASATDSLIKNK